MEEFNITSPLGNHRDKQVSSLDSALINPDVINLPRLRSQGEVEATEKLKALQNYSRERESRRILTFSSDNEEDEKAADQSPALFGHDTNFLVQDTPERNFVDEIDKVDSPKKEVNEEVAQTEEPPVKRKRGRPRKSESEKKATIVTRRSRRIVENPNLRKHQAQEPMLNILGPRPLKAAGYSPFDGLGTASSEVMLLSKRGNGKQKPLTIDAERLHTFSSRDKRFNLNTLDVLRQFVREHNPRGAKNEIINEHAVLDEFKAHLLYHVEHLMDLHASVRDISNDIAEVQRRKNQMRRNILELKQKHAIVGSDLNKARKEYTDSRLKHEEFLSMVLSFNELNAAVTKPQGDQSNLSEKIMMDLDDAYRICHTKQGLQKQLQRVNTALAQLANRL